MKTIKKLLVAALAIISLSATAQTADEIVAKNTAAMGGVEKLKTLISLKKSGNLGTPQGDFPMTMTVVQDKGFRIDLEIMGTANYQIITPEKGFMFFPIQQMTEPKELEAERVQNSQGQLDLQGSLLDYKTKGIGVEFVGTEKFNGADAYKLKVTKKNGKVSFYLIDAKSNFLVKTSSKEKGPDGTEADMDNVYSDYKQNKDGFWFAYSMETPNGGIKFDTIETNIKVDENIFKN